MTHHSTRSALLGIFLLVGSVGCVPAPQRDTTEIKNSAEIQITAGPSAKEETKILPAPAPASAPAEQVAASQTPSTEVTAEVTAAAAETTAPAVETPASAVEATPVAEVVTPTETPVPVTEAPATETAVSETPAPVAETPAADVAVTEAQPTTEPEPVPETAAAPQHEGPAKFVGRVTIRGDLPELPPLIQKGQSIKDAICAEEAIADPRVVRSADGGLANVFIYIKRTPKGVTPPAAEGGPELDQKACLFVPHAQVLRTGIAVPLKNSDPIAHNVHIKGFANQFNQLVSPDQSGVTYTFAKAEILPVNVVCDVHNWMSAWVLPLDHPWGTVTDENGQFEITNLPDGELEFTIWQEKVGYIDRAFKVNAQQGQIIEQNFEVDASKLAQ